MNCNIGVVLGEVLIKKLNLLTSKAGFLWIGIYLICESLLAVYKAVNKFQYIIYKGIL